ncbi:hypothetical protein, partial [Xanthomonas perforans]
PSPTIGDGHPLQKQTRQCGSFENLVVGSGWRWDRPLAHVVAERVAGHKIEEKSSSTTARSVTTRLSTWQADTKTP